MGDSNLTFPQKAKLIIDEITKMGRSYPQDLSGAYLDSLENYHDPRNRQRRRLLLRNLQIYLESLKGSKPVSLAIEYKFSIIHIQNIIKKMENIFQKPPKIIIGFQYPGEVVATIKLADIEAEIGYTALYALWQNYKVDYNSSHVKIQTDFLDLLHTLFQKAGELSGEKGLDHG